MDHYGSVSV